MEKSIELIISKGRTIPQKIARCNKCGKAIVSSDEYEKVRKELHPSLLSRVRNLFKINPEFVDISKGRML
ncbi:MAG: hypothetical protein NT001_02030 [Candidatus Woesearchaeota archaeon]|nr:hypothetical protein [Candidatus Woesearchaeota archaeon]